MSLKVSISDELRRLKLVDEAEFAALKDELHRVTGELAQAKKCADDWKFVAEDRDRNISNLRVALEEASSELRRARNEAEATRGMANLFHGCSESAEADFVSQVKENRALRKERDRFRKLVGKLKADLRNQQPKQLPPSSLYKINQELRKQVYDWQHTAQIRLEENEKLVGRNKLQADEIANLVKQISETKRDYEHELCKKIAEKSEKTRECEEALKDAQDWKNTACNRKKQIDQLLEEIVQASQIIQGLKKERDEVLAESFNYKGSAEGAGRVCAKLSGDLRAVREESIKVIDGLRKERDEAMEYNEELKSKLNRLKRTFLDEVLKC